MGRYLGTRRGVGLSPPVWVGTTVAQRGRGQWATRAETSPRLSEEDAISSCKYLSLKGEQTPRQARLLRQGISEDDITGLLANHIDRSDDEKARNAGKY